MRRPNTKRNQRIVGSALRLTPTYKYLFFDPSYLLHSAETQRHAFERIIRGAKVVGLRRKIERRQIIQSWPPNPTYKCSF